jgi:predicted DNA-binding transcriptional regulator AlpA
MHGWSHFQGPRRLLSREAAARYCGLSRSSFSEWVRKGRLPGPIEGTTRWDLRAIDERLDKLSGLNAPEESEALDAWRAKRARRFEGNS